MKNMILDERVIDRVCDYLFSKSVRDNVNVKNLFKSIYYIDNQQYIDKIPDEGKEFVIKLQEKIPAFARYNINFSYSLTYKTFNNLEYFINHKPDKKVADEKSNKAVKDILEKYGIETNRVTQQTKQEEIAAAICENAEKKIIAKLFNGLLAGKGSAKAIAEIINSVDTSLFVLQETLENVSAIAESLLEGINKIKSDYGDSSYAYGKDLQLLDSRELIWADPRFKQQFAIKYAKGELLLETSEDKKGLGDLIIAIDTSSSTKHKTQQNYRVIDLEIGITLAMARIAIKNRCKVKFIFFEILVYLESDWIINIREINRFFGSAFTQLNFGGTNFDNPLIQMCEPLEKREFTTSRKPGLIFVTDGYANIENTTSARVEEIKKKLGVKLYSYFVSDTDPRKYSESLTNLSSNNYWIDTKQPITQQISSFTELFK